MTTLPIDKIQPERILKELRKLWVDLGKQDEQGILRACAMTFIALVEDDGDAAPIGELIAALMHEHPSRAIVVRINEAPESALSAQVLAQCWMPFGRQQQICCEQVEIRASLAIDFPDIPSILSGLLVPDLPVVLYCPSATLWRNPEIGMLLPLTTKLVIDSSRDPDLNGAFYRLQDLAENAQLVGDLSWARLTNWREAVAQIFEEGSSKEALAHLRAISIRYSGEAPGAMALQLGGWFRSVLKESVTVKLERVQGPACAGIRSVHFECPDLEISIEMVAKDAVEVRIGDRQRRMLFPEATDYDALRQELTILSRDETFESALRYASGLLGQLK
jgi:glucose-6-phosphate dehydrogenase assembly protein OpcA